MTWVRARANNNSGGQSNIDGKTHGTGKKKSIDQFDAKKTLRTNRYHDEYVGRRTEQE